MTIVTCYNIRCMDMEWLEPELRIVSSTASKQASFSKLGTIEAKSTYLNVVD